MMVLPKLTAILGIKEAVVLQQLFWLLENPKNGKTINGHRWLYNTYEQWVDEYFPFLTPRGARRIFTELESLGLIKSCQAGGANRRKFYRLGDGYSKIIDSMLESHAAKRDAWKRPKDALAHAETPNAEISPLSPNGDVSANREDGSSTTIGTKISKPSKQPPGPKAKAPGRGMKSSACSKEQYVPKYSPDNKLLKRSSVNWPSKEWFEQFCLEYDIEDPDDLGEILHRLVRKDGKVTNCESALRGHYAERLRCTLLNNQR